MAIPVVSVADVVTTESAGFAEFVFRLDAPSSEPVSLRYQSKDGSARSAAAGIADPDFIAVGRYGYETLTFAAGETVKTVRVALVDDTMPEPGESFQLQVLLPEGLKIGTSLATATILDDQSNLIGLPMVSVEDTVVDEKAGRAYFSITLDRPSTSAVSLTYRTAQGTAVVGTDYEGLTARTMTIAAGERAKTVAIDLIDDGVREDGEYFDLLLSEVSGALMPDTRGRAFIGPSDQAVSATPVVSVADVVTDESAGFAEFVFRLDAPASEPVSLRYQSKDGSARSAAAGVADPDFIAVGRYGYETLTFAPGETVKTVRVGLVDDAVPELAESFQLQLLLPQGMKIGTSLATATIVDDRSTLSGPPVVAIEDAVVDEKGGRAYFTVTLDRPSSSAVTLSYQTADGTTTAGADYQALAPQTIVFAPGERVSTVAVNLLDDVTREDGEYFDLLLSDVSGALMPDTQGRAFIGPSDRPVSATPVVSVADVVADESKGYAEFVFRLDAPSSEAVSLRYQSKDGSAKSAAAGVADPDFIAVGRYGYETLTFAPGETVKTVRVGLVDDAAAEPAESFQLQLLLPQGLKIGTSLATATILEATSPTATPSVSVVPKSGRAEIDSLLFLGKWGGKAGTPANLTYSFPYSSDKPYWALSEFTDAGYGSLENPSPLDGDFRGFNSEEQLQAEQALRRWANVADIDFLRVEESPGSVGDIRFAVSDLNFPFQHSVGKGFPPADLSFQEQYSKSPKAGDVWLAPDIRPSMVRFALLHEVGHALGLKHPFEVDSGTKVRLDPKHDSMKYTVMSYTLSPDLGLALSNGGASVLPMTPMEYDIQAIQYLYGPNRNHNSEDNTYEFEAGRDYLVTIWDTGGHDKIVWKTSGRLDAGVIDLRPGHWSQLGNAVRYFDSESKLIGFDKDTVAMFSGSMIEDAIGGDGPDDLYGNDWSNSLTGGRGDDFIDGGSGDDTAFFLDVKSAYDVVTYSGETFVARLGGGGDGLDRLTNIEWLDFAGRKVAASAANTSLEYVASYPDLVGAFGANSAAGFSHFVGAGYLEGRTVSFSGLEYIASYPDLIRALGANAETGASHYIQAGRFEGRTTTFDGFEYVASYGDLIKAFGANSNAGAAHYIQAGRFEGRNTTFNGLDYIASHPDLINAFHDQVAANPNPDLGTLHYLQTGYFENRAADRFDADRYLANYADLRSVFGTNTQAATVHFITAGYFEGRIATPI